MAKPKTATVKKQADAAATAPVTATPPVALAQLQGEALADRARQWDDAREKLAIAGQAAAAAQVALDTLGSEATPEDRAAAELTLQAARRAVEEAEETIQQLTSGTDISTATAGEQSQAKPSEDNGATDAGKASDTGVTGDGSRSSRGDGSAASIFPPMPANVADQVEAAIAAAVESAQAMAASGNRAEAIAHLNTERDQALRFVEVARGIAERLKVEAEALGRSATCWPLTAIRYGGVLHPAGGKPFPMQPELLADLVAKGAASDTEPVTVTEEN